MSRFDRWRTSQRLLLWFVGVCAATLLASDDANARGRPRTVGRVPFSSDEHADNCDIVATCAAPPVREVGYWETKTVMQPQVSYKTVMREVVRYRPEMHQTTIQVRRLVPETRQVARRETVMVPVQRTRTEHYVSVTPSWEDVPRAVPVLVPQRKTISGTRTVCRPVMVQETETVLTDAGHFVAQSYVDCTGCERVCKVWVPNLVEERVPVAVCKMKLEKVPFSCEVTVCRPEMKRITERVYKPVYANKSRQVPYMDHVPKQVERMVEETVCREVVEDKVVEYCKMVRYVEQVAERVPVTTMVPRQVRHWVCKPSVSGNFIDSGALPADAPLAPNPRLDEHPTEL